MTALDTPTAVAPADALNPPTSVFDPASSLAATVTEPATRSSSGPTEAFVLL